MRFFRFNLVVALLLSLASSFVYAERFGDFEVDHGCNFHLQLPVQFQPSIPPRDWSSLQRFSLSTYNIFNIADHRGQYTTAADGRRIFQDGLFPKELEKIETNFKLIKQLEYGFLALQEVENGTKLEEAVTTYLDNKFEAFTFNKGSDPKSNGTSVLIPRDFPGTIQFDSHAHHYWYPSKELPNQNRKKVHLRDVVALVVRKLGSPPKSTPAMIVIVVHNKSQRDADGDPKSKIFANAQARNILLIKAQYEKQYGKDVPIAVMGDFNRNLNSKEMNVLYSSTGRSRLTNTLRTKEPTHFFFAKGGVPQHTQLDGVLMNQAFQMRLKDVRVLMEGPVPQNQEERNARASDHAPLETISDISQL